MDLNEIYMTTTSLYYSYDSTGDVLLGVFSTKEKALKCAEAHAKCYNKKEWTIVIDTVTLDKEAPTYGPVNNNPRWYSYPCDIMEESWNGT